MTGLREKFEELRRVYPAEMKSSLVLPLLHCIQEEKGYLTESDAVYVADYLGVPAMQVVEVLGWYSMFHKEAMGRNVIKICRNISCALRGAERLIEHLRARLGVDVGETTAEGRFTLLTVECLASCGTAPAMQVNDTYYERLDEAKIDQVLKDLP